MKEMLKIQSKLPEQATNIFTHVSALATKYKAINLGQGFPDFDVAPELLDLVNKYTRSGKNQYAPMQGLPQLREVLCDKAHNLYGARLKADSEITITAGATQAIFTTISAFVFPGDEVIILEPAYDSYAPSINIAGGKVIPYRLHAPDFRIDWIKFSALISDKTRMIIINTPHNPIGKTLAAEDLKKLESLLRPTNIILLSDEVYEHLVFDGQVHQSVLRFPELWKRSIAIFSFGKTFHATGWKIGYVMAPDYLMKEIRAVHQWNVFCANSFLQFALADYLRNKENYLSLPMFYQKKRDLFESGLKSSRFKAHTCEGTYFQLYDYSSIADDHDLSFVQKLIENHGVAAIPISPFYSQNPNSKLIRFCFAKKDSTLEKAIEKLNKI